MNKTVWWVAVFLGLALMNVGCSSNAIEVLVRVANLPSNVKALNVFALLNAKSAETAVEFTAQLGQFGIKLPLDAGSQGTLQIKVNGLASDRCLLSTGTLDATTSLSTPYSEVDIALASIGDVNGKAWTTQPTSNDGYINGVWGIDANNVWLSGQFGILKWNGTAWLQQAGADQFQS
ncbi:hypothetical protein BVG81_009305, partial [Haliangium sp. UPWRP_2]